MKTKTYVWHGALVGMIAAMAVGCGGSGTQTPSSSDPTAGGSAAISTLGPAVVDGCNMSLAFDLTAPQNIGWIAVQGLNQLNKSSSSSAANQMQFALWKIDSQGQQTQVQKSATQASAQLCALLEQATNNSSLTHVANTAVANQRNYFSQIAKGDRNVSGTTTNSASQTEVLNQNQTNEYLADHTAHNDSAAASQAANSAQARNASEAAASQVASQNASQSANADALNKAINNNGSLFNQLVNVTTPPVCTAGCLGGIDPSSFINQMLNNNSFAFTAQSAKQAAEAAQDSNVAANQSAANSSSQRAAASNASSAKQNAATHDYVVNNTGAHLDHAVSSTQTTSTVQHADETASIVTDQVAHSDLANDNLAEQANHADSLSNRVESNAASQSAFAYSDLDQLQSNHYVLQVNLNASQNQAAFNLFQGNGNNVFQSQSFAQPLPACGVDP